MSLPYLSSSFLKTPLSFLLTRPNSGILNTFAAALPCLSSNGGEWAISELLFVSVSKRVLVLNYCEGNEFDLHNNWPFRNSAGNWGEFQVLTNR